MVELQNVLSSVALKGLTIRFTDLELYRATTMKSGWDGHGERSRLQLLSIHVGRHLVVRRSTQKRPLLFFGCTISVVQHLH